MKLFYKSFSLKPRGFTLIELLIVISIIGILSSLLMSNYIGAQQRGRDGQRKSDLKQIQIALEQYKADNGHYPCADTGDSTYGWQVSGVTPWIVDHYHAGYNCGVNGADMALSPTYLSKMPKDPLNISTLSYPWVGGDTYAYYSYFQGWGTCASGSFYMLLGPLENKNDKDRLAAGNNYTYCGVDMVTLFGGLTTLTTYPTILNTAP